MATPDQIATQLPDPDAPTQAEREATARAAKADADLEPALEAQRRERAEARREAPRDDDETPSDHATTSRHARMQKLFADLDRESQDAEAKQLQSEAAAELDAEAEDVIRPQVEAAELIDRYESEIKQHKASADEKQAIIDDALRLAKEDPLTLLEELQIDPAMVARYLKNMSDPVAVAKIRERQMQDMAKQAHHDRERAKIENEFLDSLSDLNPTWRKETGFDRQRAIALGDEIANEATRMGYTFSLQDIADATLILMADEQNKRTETRTKLAEGTQAKAKAAAKKPKATPSPTSPQDWKRERENRLARMYRSIGGRRYE